LQIGKKSKDSHQHTGLGKKLMKEAEKISKELGIKKIIVTSGVGVREYYRVKHRYQKDGVYMSKLIKNG
jgi:elongator complex protein 3